jgi:RNA polymerase sigma-70 factor (ECF subfamily)
MMESREERPPDRELVEAAREGDEKAFIELVRRYEPRVAATVIGMLGDVPEADDVGQETFVRFYRALRSFRGESGLGTYLTRIAINLSLNELRRRRRRFFLFPRSDAADLPEAPDERRDEAAALEAKEAVHRALQRLEPEFRAVVVLRLLDGYSTRETAEILDIPAGTVLSRLARGQKKLRKILDPLLGGRVGPAEPAQSERERPDE